MPHQRLQIVNIKGLHARASARLAELCERHNARAEVSKDGLTTAGDSIMGLLMLAATKGSYIDVTTSGEDADALAAAIAALVADKFGEGD